MSVRQSYVYNKIKIKPTLYLDQAVFDRIIKLKGSGWSKKSYAVVIQSLIIGGIEKLDQEQTQSEINLKLAKKIKKKKKKKKKRSK